MKFNIVHTWCVLYLVRTRCKNCIKHNIFYYRCKIDQKEDNKSNLKSSTVKPHIDIGQIYPQLNRLTNKFKLHVLSTMYHQNIIFSQCSVRPAGYKKIYSDIYMYKSSPY